MYLISPSLTVYFKAVSFFMFTLISKILHFLFSKYYNNDKVKLTFLRGCT